MEEPPVHLFVGHGLDTVIDYNQRPIVPEDSTVVMFSDHGVSILVETCKDIWKKMYSTPELFKDPIGNKKEIEDAVGATMHIYPAGTPMPVVHHYLNLYFHSGTDYESLTSGSYDFPLPYPHMRELKRYDNLFSDDQIEYLYSGDANEEFRKDIFGLDRTQGKISSYDLYKIFYPTPDLVDKQGPGIHYLLSCRAIEPESLERVMGNYNPILVKKIINTFENENIPFEKVLTNTEEKLLKDALMLKYTNALGIVRPLTDKSFELYLKGIKNNSERNRLIKSRASAKKFLERKNVIKGELSRLRNKVRLTRQKSREFQTARFPTLPKSEVAARKNRKTRKQRLRKE